MKFLNLDKIKNSKITKIAIIAIILLISFVIYYYNFLLEMNSLELINTSGFYKKIFLFLGGITLIGTIVSCILINTKKKENLHKQYFIIALILGLCYLFTIPMFAQSDEHSHYLRAYEISNGHFLTPVIDNEQKSEFDKSIIDSIYNTDKTPEYKTYEEILEIKDLKVNNQEKVSVVNGASCYSIISYLPHVIGISLGKILHLNPYFCGMIGRIFSLLFCISIVSLGIKILPEGKFFAFTLFLTPIFLSYSASFSADGTIMAYTFIFISYILSLIKSKKKLNYKNFLILLTLTICVSISKSVYLPFIFLLLFIPKESFKNKKEEIFWKVLLIGIGIFSDLIWVHLSSVILNNSRSSIIKNQPFKYLLILLNTTINSGYNQLENIFSGDFLCHHQVRPYEMVCFGFIIVNFLSYVVEEKNKESNVPKNLFILLLMIAVYGLINTAMFIGNTPVDSSLIIGVQGRYLFPIVIATLMLKITKPVKINTDYISYANIILNYLVLLTIIRVFIF